jgi:hypothetical protein
MNYFGGNARVQSVESFGERELGTLVLLLRCQ